LTTARTENGFGNSGQTAGRLEIDRPDPAWSAAATFMSPSDVALSLPVWPLLPKRPRDRLTLFLSDQTNIKKLSRK